MFYPTYKCKMCATVETDYGKGYQEIFHYDIDASKPSQKFHICVENKTFGTTGVMELIGFQKRKEE